MFKNIAKGTLQRVLKVSEVVITFLLFLIIILTFVDVVGRYFFAKPIFGAAEIVEFLLITAIFVGLLIINVRDEHISVDMFEHHVVSRIPRVHAIAVKGAAILIMALVAWHFIFRAIEDYEQKAQTVVLEWPLFWMTSMVACLSSISVICQILALAGNLEAHHENTETLRGIE